MEKQQRLVAMTKCLKCDTYVPLHEPHEAICSRCGRCFSVKSDSITWIPEEHARVAIQLLRQGGKFYITKVNEE